MIFRKTLFPGMAMKPALYYWWSVWEERPAGNHSQKTVSAKNGNQL
jgi:hypothetical protein